MPMAQATAARAFGISYFDFGNTGHVKTATEVSFDNSALMRSIARHEHLLEGALVGLPHVPLHMSRSFGKQLADEDEARILFDDSIISDTAAEKAQDTAEANVTMHAREYRQKRYGEDERTAKARACGLGKDDDSGRSSSATIGKRLLGNHRQTFWMEHSGWKFA